MALKISNRMIMQLLVFPMSFFMVVALRVDDLSELVVDYFTNKDEGSFLTAFTCLEDPDKFEMSRRIMNASMKATVLDPKQIVNAKLSVNDLMRYSYYYYYVVADLECEGIEQLMHECSNHNLFNYSYPWLLVGDENYARNLMSAVNLSVNADVVVASESAGSMRLYDVFNTGSDRNGTLNFTYIGTWKRGEGIDLIPLQSMVYRRANLTGITLKFAITITYMDKDDDYMRYLSDTGNRSYDSIARLNYAIALPVHGFFNYSVEMSVWENYGGLNGESFGMLGSVGRGESDFTMSATVITEGRIAYVSPLFQSYPFWSAFMFRHPKVQSIRNVFLEPLAPSTWNGVIALSTIVSILLVITSCYDHRNPENPWSFSFYLTLATLFQQGWSTLPPIMSGRIILFMFLIFSMLLYDFYSAFIVSSLLSGKAKTVRTFADLFETGISAAIENISYTPIFFNNSKDPWEKNFYKQRLWKNGKLQIMSKEEALQHVKAGGFAYHTVPIDWYDEIAKAFTPTEICDLTEVTFIRETVLSLMGQIDNPYTEHLKVLYRRLQEVGVLAREQRKWFARKPECQTSLIIMSIGLDDTGVAFLVLFFGMIAAMVILAIEHLYKEIMTRHRGTNIKPWVEWSSDQISKRREYFHKIYPVGSTRFEFVD